MLQLRYRFSVPIMPGHLILFEFYILLGIDQKLLRGEGGHYLCREGHNFFEQNFAWVTIFLPKLREGHNFFYRKTG